MENQFSDLVSKLSEKQLSIITDTLKILLQPFIYKEFYHNDALFTDEIIDCIGDFIKIHHSFSKEPFSKDKFEYTLEKAFILSGFNAKLASKGNRGHDIIINDKKVSLKTQADKNIKENKIHISKFMELGKGEWILSELRKQFINHIKKYDLIYSLRCLSSDDERNNSVWSYELVNIPKSLLIEAKTGKLIEMNESKQNPKPGYCNIYDSTGKDNKFQLYFDGGTERKLQIKNLKKDYCILVAKWKFAINELRD